MRNFQDIFEICKRFFISDFSICMTLPLSTYDLLLTPCIQFVIFKPLSYCFEETIRFDVKTSFASRTFHRLKITNCIKGLKDEAVPCPTRLRLGLLPSGKNLK